MICKKCGKEIDSNYYRATKKSHNELMKLKNDGIAIPNSLFTTYKDYHGILLCENCDEPVEYIDTPLQMFFEWLKFSSEKGDTHEASGKAIIRYFELDKLLELKKDAGDLNR